MNIFEVLIGLQQSMSSPGIIKASTMYVETIIIGQFEISFRIFASKKDRKQMPEYC